MAMKRSFVSSKDYTQSGPESLACLLRDMRTHAEAWSGYHCDERLMNYATRQPQPLKPPITPTHCSDCHSHHVCVDTELGCLVCCYCGLQGPIGFEHGAHNLYGKDSHKPYQYKAVTYMWKHLRRIQGQPTKVSREELLQLEACLKDVPVRREDLLPLHVFDALKKCRLVRLYAHRWFVTMLLNPWYEPLHLSDYMETRLQAVFQSSYEQFLRLYVWNSPKRPNFPSYLLFIHIVLQYLGVPDVDRHFTPMRKRYRDKASEKVCSLIKSI